MVMALQSIAMPPQETPPGVVAAAASDAAVHHPSKPSVKGHRDHKRKRRNYGVANDALPPPQEQELIAAWARSTIDAGRGATEHAAPEPTGGAHRSQRRAPAQSTIDAGRGATEHAAPTGGAHRSRQRRAPAAERTGAGGGSSSRDDEASTSVAPPPGSTSIKAIRVNQSSSSIVIVGGKQHPAAGSGISSPGGVERSYYGNSHPSAAPSSSATRLIIRIPAAAPPPPEPHLPAEAKRPRSASSNAPSASVPVEPNHDDGERFRQGVAVFAGWNVATQRAAVNRFVEEQQQQPPPPEGGGFSFWLTQDEAAADLKYVDDMVEAQRKTASGSEKPAGTDTS